MSTDSTPAPGVRYTAEVTPDAPQKTVYLAPFAVNRVPLEGAVLELDIDGIRARSKAALALAEPFAEDAYALLDSARDVPWLLAELERLREELRARETEEN